ncbi:MAG: choice-of-anchor tandem repeat GloVer-containing protein [Limisphaerales bacterium]
MKFLNDPRQSVKQLIWLSTLAFASSLHAQTFELLHTFSPFLEGDYSRARLVQGSNGNFYGSTFYGGSDINRGTLFKITPNGVFTRLVVLDDLTGWVEAEMIEGNDGNFYGTSSLGGVTGNDGMVFKLAPDGIRTTVASFSFPNGWVADSGVIQARDGNFYGTTLYGGAYGDNYGTYGTVFKMTPNGSLTTMVSFAGTNGANPGGGLMQASDGNVYGTTRFGGDLRGGTSFGAGTVFRMTPEGLLTTLVIFNYTNGAGSSRRMIQASDGLLYGSTAEGGIGHGTIFKMTTNGVLTTLVAFDGTNGAGSPALIQARDGNFYGACGGGAHNDGIVFKMTPQGELRTLFSFNYWSESGGGSAGIIEGSDGNFYGTTSGGGAYLSGTVFRIVMPGPQLNFIRTGNQLILSWPTNAVGFTLQSITNLTSTNWINSTDCPFILGGQYTVVNNLSSGSRFYRLKK